MTLKEQINWCESQIKAGYHVVVIRSILARLKGLDKKEPPHPYHQQAVIHYAEFLEYHKLPFLMDARQGKALGEILKKLQQVSIEKTPESAINSFRVVLTHWDKTGDHLSRIKTLSHINNNLLEIIDKIKNGATKKQAGVNAAEQLANQINAKHSTGAV